MNSTLLHLRSSSRTHRHESCSSSPKPIPTISPGLRAHQALPPRAAAVRREVRRQAVNFRQLVLLREDAQRPAQQGADGALPARGDRRLLLRAIDAVAHGLDTRSTGQGLTPTARASPAPPHRWLRRSGFAWEPDLDFLRTQKTRPQRAL